jgi:ABC-type multidrug transport system fused ATPase/permease subunit
VSLQLKPNSLTAIIGRSGSGKSTLLKVLLGLVSPNTGRVLLNGQPLTARAGLFGFVAQEPHLWHDTVLENLRLAKPLASESEIWAALELAGANDFVAALPMGLSTIIGERGLRLSGGERQRLALARVFLQDAPILVIDEATSSLDAYSQEKIESALRFLAKSRTVFMVVHRLEMVRLADQIILLEAGQVVNHGSHTALLARDKTYQQLWRNGVRV